ncbi:MAG: response regulator [bacterium]
MYKPSKRGILLKPSEIAKRLGILTSKITYYTTMGLFRPAEISDGGQKLYDENETVIQFERINKLICKGLQLNEIKERIAFARRLRRLFIIDDEKDVIDLIIDVLKDEFNFDINYAMDGFSAGKMLNSFFPDLIILDLNLPGINGFELCKQIRGDSLQCGVKIIAVTGYDDPSTVQRIMESGADAYMAKPFNVEEFKNKVFSMLQIKKKKNKEFLASKNENE